MSPPNVPNYLTVQYSMTAMLVLLYFALFIIEKKWPLRKPTRPLLPRLVINFSFTVLVFIIASTLIGPLVKFTINLTSTHKLGLLSFIPLNKPMLFVLGFLLMDLSFYYWHKLNHIIPILWRFHTVHHVDPDLDISTSMRFHVVEIMYSSLFRIGQLALIGIDPLTFFCYEIVFQTNTFFQHSNVKLPILFERLLNKIMVTPRMHGIHHSNYQNETNQNYGVVFSFWDRMHRTLKLDVPQQSITIGVPGYSRPSDNTLIHLLTMPIKTQRPYWQQDHINRKPEGHDKDIKTLCE